MSVIEYIVHCMRDCVFNCDGDCVCVFRSKEAILQEQDVVGSQFGAKNFQMNFIRNSFTMDVAFFPWQIRGRIQTDRNCKPNNFSFFEFR
jgi:hypothetical protein